MSPARVKPHRMGSLSQYWFQSLQLLPFPSIAQRGLYITDPVTYPQLLFPLAPQCAHGHLSHFCLLVAIIITECRVRREYFKVSTAHTTPHHTTNPPIYLPFNSLIRTHPPPPECEVNVGRHLEYLSVTKSLVPSWNLVLMDGWIGSAKVCVPFIVP
jgi:hypothetical protein